MAVEIDWHKRRHELREGMVFFDYEDRLVRLDRSVPGDATQWYVATWYGGDRPHWSYEDATIEPGDLRGLPKPDPGNATPGPFRV